LAHGVAAPVELVEGLMGHVDLGAGGAERRVGVDTDGRPTSRPLFTTLTLSAETPGREISRSAAS
jgi:hypothetical protein